MHVEKNAGLNCGRVGPVDGGLDVGHDSGIGHKLGEVASDGSDGWPVVRDRSTFAGENA